MPDPDGRICAVLGLVPNPIDRCASTIGQVNATAGGVNPAVPKVPPQSCNSAPPLPTDQSVVIVNRQFTPDGVTTAVVVNHWLYFQNLDNVGHAIADQRCLDDSSKACRWAPIGSPVGGFATTAKGIFIGGSFHSGDVVPYYCTIHPLMKGTFTVA